MPVIVGFFLAAPTTAARFGAMVVVVRMGVSTPTAAATATLALSAATAATATAMDMAMSQLFLGRVSLRDEIYREDQIFASERVVCVERDLVAFDLYHAHDRRVAIRARLKIIADLYFVHGELGDRNRINLRFVPEAVTLFRANDNFIALAFPHGKQTFLEAFDDLTCAGEKLERTAFRRLVQDLAGLIAKCIIEGDDLLCRHFHTQSACLDLGKP